MTAANAFARADGAWLFFDTAVYDRDGFVLSMGSKIVASDRLGLAIGLCGLVPPNRNAIIAELLARQPDQAVALESLPDLTRTLSCPTGLPDRAPLWRRLIWKTPAPSCKPGITICAAWWDAEEGCGMAGIVTDTADLGPNYPPFTLHGVRNMTSPRPDFGDWFDFNDDLRAGLDFDPMRDGAALGALERRQPNERGGYRVGGAFERVRVHADGIDRETVLRWPDRIGRPIKVAA